MDGNGGDVFVTGAAGFIGSHLVDHLLKQGKKVWGVDNFILGRRENLADAFKNPNFSLVEADMADKRAAQEVCGPLFERRKIDTVWHLAANSDISAGINDPYIDLQNTFLSTFNLLQLMKQYGSGKLAFASSSAIYGNLQIALEEDSGPLFPVSSYGAMKLASEAIISAAVEAFLKQVWIFRFPNVVGSRSTHGVIHDLLGKLKLNGQELTVLGDGTQCKPYLHVSDLIDALSFIHRSSLDRINYYNIGQDDEGATVSFIAQEVVKAGGFDTKIVYTGGNRGWVGDVPRFSYVTRKLKELGWRPRLASREAVGLAVREIALEKGFVCR